MCTPLTCVWLPWLGPFPWFVAQGQAHPPSILRAAPPSHMPKTMLQNTWVAHQNLTALSTSNTLTYTLLAAAFSLLVDHLRTWFCASAQVPPAFQLAARPLCLASEASSLWLAAGSRHYEGAPLNIAAACGSSEPRPRVSLSVRRACRPWPTSSGSEACTFGPLLASIAATAT